MEAARPRRATRPPSRLDTDADDPALKAAIKASLAMASKPRAPLTEAPVLHPTPAEWSHPLEYIRSIWSIGEEHGIVKIVPPPCWRPRDRFTGVHAPFVTKRQSLRKLQEGITFGHGDTYSLAGYKGVADRNEERYLKLKEFQDVLKEEKAKRGVAINEDDDVAFAKALERHYWRLVKGGGSHILVDYGSDLDAHIFPMGGGTAPPKNPRAHQDKPGTSRQWELASLVFDQKSLLKNLPEHIDGVTRPWTYVGMLYATFCWHTEDHFLASLNYMHQGAGKTWYDQRLFPLES